jgi:hypothetical protein
MGCFAVFNRVNQNWNKAFGVIISEVASCLDSKDFAKEVGWNI